MSLLAVVILILFWAVAWLLWFVITFGDRSLAVMVAAWNQRDVKAGHLVIPGREARIVFYHLLKDWKAHEAAFRVLAWNPQHGWFEASVMVCAAQTAEPIHFVGWLNEDQARHWLGRYMKTESVDSTLRGAYAG